jgi:branched-chain amino acid transport system ATP-binding protein
VWRRPAELVAVGLNELLCGLVDPIDRAVVINFGRRIADGSPEEITSDSTVQEAYLGGAEI